MCSRLMPVSTKAQSHGRDVSGDSSQGRGSSFRPQPPEQLPRNSNSSHLDAECTYPLSSPLSLLPSHTPRPAAFAVRQNVSSTIPRLGRFLPAAPGRDGNPTHPGAGTASGPATTTPSRGPVLHKKLSRSPSRCATSAVHRSSEGICPPVAATDTASLSRSGRRSCLRFASL